MKKIVRIKVDTLGQSRQSFSLENVSGFSINNKGDTDAKVGYVGKPREIDIEVSEKVIFEAPDNCIFDGEMNVEFKGSNTGRLQVIKYVEKDIQE